MKPVKDYLSTGSMNPIYKKPVQKLLFYFVVAAVIFLWGTSELLTEKLYSNALYPIVSVVLRTLSGIFPFAIGDVCYFLLICYIIWCVYLFFKKLYHQHYHHTHRILIPMQVLQFGLILYIAFKLLWGLNYSRPSIATTLGISNHKYNDKELVELAKFLIQKINYLEQLKQQTSTNAKNHSSNAFSKIQIETKDPAKQSKFSNVNSNFKQQIETKTLLNRVNSAT